MGEDGVRRKLGKEKARETKKLKKKKSGYDSEPFKIKFLKVEGIQKDGKSPNLGLRTCTVANRSTPTLYTCLGGLSGPQSSPTGWSDPTHLLSPSRSKTRDLESSTRAMGEVGATHSVNTHMASA